MTISRTGHIALSGMKESVRRLQVSSHNVANSLTNGFKASEIRSADMVAAGQGMGVNTLAIFHATDMGPFINTGRMTDVAISGRGYFVLQDSNGKTFYTRNGSFHKDSQGFLVNDEGLRVINADGNPIPAIPEGFSDVQIGNDGKIRAVDSSGNIVELGNDYTVGVALIQDEANLVEEGGTLYSLPPGSPNPELGVPGEGERGTLVSGFLEGSNVDISKEMVNQVMAKNAYEANLKVLEVSKEMTESLLEIKT